MCYYFGLIPSQELQKMIDEAQQLVNGQQNVAYYPYRNAIIHKIAQEHIDHLLNSLIDIISNPERQASMHKIVSMISHTIDTLLNHILGKDDNDTVLQSFYFLQNQSTFIDLQGQERIGFQMTQAEAKNILAGFDLTKQLTIKNDEVNLAALKKSMDTLVACNLQHFLLNFSQTLQLGMLKRKAIPMAQAGIMKGTSIATNKLLPQLPIDAQHRLVTHFESFMVKK